MRECVIAVFGTTNETDAAASAVESSGIPASAIRRYRRDDPNAPQAVRDVETTAEQSSRPTPTAEDVHDQPASETTGGFWSWLFGEDTTYHSQREYDRDYATFNRAVERGYTILAVTVEDTQSARIVDVLSKHNPMELDTDTVSGSPREPKATDETTKAIPTPSAAPTGATTPTETTNEEVIPLGEEHLEVGKRQVDRTKHIRRYVVERPVEAQVNLRQERTTVERRPATERSQAMAADSFKEGTTEIHETKEEPVVNKTANVGEEVVVKKETTERPETVRDTVRKEEVDTETGTMSGRSRSAKEKSTDRSKT